ncbi:MAG: uncharacterized protein KVP18_003093 [Porospora cf. gigantea A]|uniref:uncharacterized protein n=2 Tax=Porospora cf. gigantea A TaxID=2853593 RepID=UPI00355A4256|nr:MAG: hypothetical protein KVP18_003093 [Porospora cf. gigantea A]
MKTRLSFVLSAGMAASPAWLTSSINESTPINGVSFEDFLMRHASKNLRSLQEAGGVNEFFDNCNVRFELAINQDVSGSFANVVKQFRRSISSLVREVSALYPGSRIGFSTFSDKPIPISGFGDHGAYPSRFIRDHCYRLRSPLTGNADALSHSIANVNISGGGDYKENLLGSLVSVGNDSAWGFSKGLTGGFGDDSAMIRVVLSTTDALPHEAGDAKVNTQNWNEYWGTDGFKESWTLHYGSCREDGRLYSDLVQLRTKYEAGTLTAGETARFDELRELCGPWKFPEGFLPHGGVVDTPSNCLNHEYPTPEDAARALNNIDGVIPVLLTPSANAGLIYVKLHGNCPDATSEAKCLRQHYQQMFFEAGLSGLFYSLEGESIPSINDIILFALETIKYMYCTGSALTSEFPTPTVESGTSASLEPTTKPTGVPSDFTTPCVCIGNVCPCFNEMRINVGVNVPISKWASFMSMFGPWVKIN